MKFEDVKNWCKKHKTKLIVGGIGIIGTIGGVAAYKHFSNSGHYARVWMDSDNLEVLEDGEWFELPIPDKWINDVSEISDNVESVNAVMEFNSGVPLDKQRAILDEVARDLKKSVIGFEKAK